MIQGNRPIGKEDWDSLRGVLRLSRRETDVLQFLVSGKTESQTAAVLGISLHAVHYYSKRLCAKLHVRRRTQLAIRVENALRACRDRANPPDETPLQLYVRCLEKTT